MVEKEAYFLILKTNYKQGKRSSHKPPKHGIAQWPNLIGTSGLVLGPNRGLFRERES